MGKSIKQTRKIKLHVWIAAVTSSNMKTDLTAEDRGLIYLLFL